MEMKCIDEKYLLKEAQRTLDESDSTAAFCLCQRWILKDAITLLKEQEARILDWDELEDCENAVWFEEKDEQDCYIALMANVGTFDATIVNVEPGKCHRLAYLHEFYKKEWRCWSAEPTAKQRQAVKWE